ncbi:hypothetical protein [Mucisphaera calidilacus]|uniref:Uncharacterized protein n=1 Tax=Mucisphaera calidilacus TaxID=2527982 RepID=A0A518BW56_9BACT|nr:hypothetical protein [Mucisphaera calidilacus]QDU71209.1 hypothetical protein Pan265_10580 [Mucisphaera calidilacus]
MSTQDIIQLVVIAIVFLGPMIGAAIKSINDKRSEQLGEAYKADDGMTVQERIDRKSQERREAMLRARQQRQAEARERMAGRDLSETKRDNRPSTDGTITASTQTEPRNLSNSQEAARAKAQEAYRRRAEALRQRAAAQRQAAQQRAQPQTPAPQSRPQPAAPQPVPQQRQRPTPQPQPQRQQTQRRQPLPSRQTQPQRKQQSRSFRPEADAPKQMSVREKQATNRSRLIGMLDDPARLRDLIILREVLDKPLALRDSRI